MKNTDTIEKNSIRSESLVVNYIALLNVSESVVRNVRARPLRLIITREC